MPYKLQVIFRKRATIYRALLRKMTYEDKASYDSTPPHTSHCRMIGTSHCKKSRKPFLRGMTDTGHCRMIDMGWLQLVGPIKL